MVRKICHTALMILIFFLFVGKSCEPDPGYDSEARSEATEDYTLSSIRSEFETPLLTDEKILLYHETGKQKIQEFADYLGLYASGSTDSSFKPQIKDMIFRLFYDSTAHVQLSLSQYAGIKDPHEDLAGLLQELASLPHPSVTIIPSELKIIQPLQFESEGRFTGILGCNIRIAGVLNHDTALLYQGKAQIGFMAALKDKQFGEENNLHIWQVFLEQIHEQDEAYE